MAELAVKLSASEEEQIADRETENVAAHDAFLLGWQRLRLFTPEDQAQAVQSFERAVELDPDYGRAYAALAISYWNASELGWMDRLGVGTWASARSRAATYLSSAMRRPTPLAHQVATWMHLGNRQHEEAIEQAERAIALDPNDPDGQVAMAQALIFGGQPEEAIAFVERAMRLDPHYPANYLYVLGLAYFGMERLEDAVRHLERALERNPFDYVPSAPLAAAYAYLGREQEARIAFANFAEGIEQSWELRPDARWIRIKWGYKEPEDVQRLLNGLRMAGL